MSTINANIADYLTQIERLTSTNLQILKTLNDSFYTKKNHLFAEIDDTAYVIPSFLSLENKINMLQENFENLVKAPETCEAYFNFDGNTRAIEVRKYSHVPNSITIPTITKYGVDSNDIFKDFMTPVPYINLDLPYLPNDVVEVNVKKIVPKSDTLKNLFKNKLAFTVESTDNNGVTFTDIQYKPSVNEKYGDIYKLLLNYKEDYDYVEYDTIYKLPVRKNIGTATYVIETVVSDVIDDELNEVITLKLRNNLTDSSLNNKLTYKLFDDTIEKPLQVGDELINYDGTGKVVITDVRPSTSTITVKVVNGEYLNFLGTDSYDTDNDRDIHDLSKLRFHAAIDFDADKYIKIPLEEDQYVFIAVAALNSRMNIQSSWGTGIVIDAHKLMNDNDTKSFKTYYDENVKNIGDVLFEMTSMITSPLTSLSQDTFEKIISAKPGITKDSFSVMQINKHLNNSETVKNIRDAYNQKKNAEQELSEVQTKIDEINTHIASLSFNDASGTRAVYTSQLSILNTKKNELLKVINDSINSISISVNSSEIPIENAKYRIRGFYIPDLEVVNNLKLNDHVIGLDVQYRYKNISTELGNAVSITGVEGETYIYSEWNNLNNTNKSKIAKCVDGNYSYFYEENNEKINEPSYNQVDIPISQGESVDIRIRTIYDFGQPYVKVSSAWSEIINIEFPSEFAKDVPVLTIIEENNNDIETNRFNNILNDTGVNSHIQDMIIDQNTVYYHKPDNIASGFYTEVRRVIPLKEKLQTLSSDIALLKSEIVDPASNCSISLMVGDSSTTIYPNSENNITHEAYNNFTANTNSSYGYGNNGSIGTWDISGKSDEDSITADGNYTFINGVVSTIINIVIKNTGSTALKLYPIFPGNKDVEINSAFSGYVNKLSYCGEIGGGVWIRYQHTNDNNTDNNYADKLQTQNQFLTFRITDLWTGQSIYAPNVGVSTNNLQNLFKIDNVKKADECAMAVYPYLTTIDGLSIISDSTRTAFIVNPGEEIVVPVMCEYVATEPNTAIQKTISFDIRTSLYTDPINYKFTVIGKNTSTFQDKLTNTNKKRFWQRLASPTKYVLR